MCLRESNLLAVTTVDVQRHAAPSTCILTDLQQYPVSASSGQGQCEDEKMQTQHVL